MRRPILLLLVLASACTRATPSAGPTLDPNAVTIAVKGDWGAGSVDQRAITTQMCAQRARTPFKIVMTTGDNFYLPDGLATQENYYVPEKCLLDAGITWRAVWGNHDFGHPDTGRVLGAKHWYSWSAGGADFFALDSNVPSSATQRAWLVRALSSSTARIKIVYFHHPAYTGGGHPNTPGVDRNWVPLFERYHVTLVLTGHNHDYEHSLVNGIDYVVSGGGGRYLTPCFTHPRTLLRCDVENHFLLLTVGPSSVVVRALLASGETLDQFTINADSR